MASPEYDALMAELKRLHHRLDEIKDDADETKADVELLKIQQARESGARDALHAMRSESYRLVAAVAAIAVVAVGVSQVFNG